MEVYIVITECQFDSDDIEVYAKKETAIDAADQLLYELKSDGYEIDCDYGDEETTFAELSMNDTICILLSSENGDARITVMKKTAR